MRLLFGVKMSFFFRRHITNTTCVEMRSVGKTLLLTHIIDCNKLEITK